MSGGMSVGMGGGIGVSIDRRFNTLALKALLLTEVRLRMRRTGTLVAVLALIAATWLMVGDPADGRALLVVDSVRVAYTSTCLAIGSAGLAGFLFGLAGFYLVRGRMAEDLRSGAGAVLGATPVGDAVFLFGRWLGSVAYLCGLLLAFMATVMVLQAVRGEGPIQPLVYLQAFALVLLPLVFFIASVALLCDAWAPLAGKGGDVLYFILFIALIPAGAIPVSGAHGQWSPWLLLDFSGLGSTVLAFRSAISTENFVLGGGDFDAALAPILLPESLWTAQIAFTRAACALIALLPLAPAILLFHRFSPDRVKVRAVGSGWSPLALANRLLRPLTRLLRPLFALAARTPGLPGYALAVLAMALAINPAAIAAVLGLFVAGCLVGGPALGGVVIAAIAVWGTLVSEISVRDVRHDVDAMSGAAPGGGERRFAAQWMAACLLALLLLAPVLLRWLSAEPLRAAALVTGVLALASAASLLGGASRSARTFLALFLFGLYVATQAVKVPVLDVVGFNGVANMQGVLQQSLIGVLLFVGGLMHEKWRQAKN
jgi:hypothetical protein